MLEITGFNRTTNHSVVLQNYMHGKFHVLFTISSFKISLFKFWPLIKGLKINFASGKINLRLSDCMELNGSPPFKVCTDGHLLLIFKFLFS